MLIIFLLNLDRYIDSNFIFLHYLINVDLVITEHSSGNGVLVSKAR